MLNDKLFISVIETDIGVVLSSHHSPSDSVLLVIFFIIVSSCSGLKLSFLCLHEICLFFHFHLFSNSSHNFLLCCHSFLSKLWKIVSWVISSSNMGRLANKWNWFFLSVNSVHGAIKWLVWNDWHFEVTWSLWNVFSYNGSINKLSVLNLYY